MSDGALVLFSGGQDSTTCLAWALSRFDTVETVGFDYGQRHRIELDQRPRLREALVEAPFAWRGTLGADHTIDLSALGAISATAMTRDIAIASDAKGLPNTFVPRPQPPVLHLRRRAGASARAAPSRRRHVRDRLFRLPGLSRRHLEGHAGRAQPRHGEPLRRRDPADVARQGGDLRARAGRSAARRSSTSCSRRPTPATSANAAPGTSGATAAVPARPALCARAAGAASSKHEKCNLSDKFGGKCTLGCMVRLRPCPRSRR